MTFRFRTVQVLAAALLLAASAAVAADQAAAPPQGAAPLALLPLAGSSSASACPVADLPSFLSPSQPQPLQAGGCGACSVASCVGKFPNASCGAAGFRCIESGFCGASTQRLCKCLII